MGCLGFLENVGSTVDIKVKIMSKVFMVPFKSTSLLNCSNGGIEELFNSAKVAEPAQHRALKPAPSASSFGNFAYWQEPRRSVYW